MTTTFQEIELSSEQWEELASNAIFGHLLQTHAWANLQEKLNRTSIRIAIGEAGEKGEHQKPVLIAQLFVMPLMFGKTYLYCPRGPIFTTNKEDNNRAQIIDAFAKAVKTHARREKSIFLRVEPAWLAHDKHNLADALRQVGFTVSNHHMQPAQTRTIDLTLSEDEILAQMKQKARYNIRLAARKGVIIESTTSAQAIDDFYRLLAQTTSRNEFAGHEKSYYRYMIEELGKHNMITIYQAKVENEIIASIIVAFHQASAIYLHGASSYEHRKLMAPYLLQWKAIQDAKQRGCATYDFWGVAPEGASTDHRWAGVTRFKDGFGGTYQEFVGTWQLPLQKAWYTLFQAAQFVRSRR
jgi:peptidoglycan pentaglycine glycine transferase (the first glycine)